MKGAGLLVFVALLAGTAPSAAQVPAPVDSTAVRLVVERYLHGLRFNDVASLKEAFWPGAKLFWIRRDGQLGQLSQDDWYRGFAGSAGKEEAGSLRVAALDVTGDAASVKVVEEYAQSTYTDYLSLLRLGGRWWIVHKIYTVARR